MRRHRQLRDLRAGDGLRRRDLRESASTRRRRPATRPASASPPTRAPARPTSATASQCFNVCTTNDQCKTPNICTSNSCGLKGSGRRLLELGGVPGRALLRAGLLLQLRPAPGPASRAPSRARSASAPTSPPTRSTRPRSAWTKRATSCGTNGKCDGNGGCQLYVQGTTCVALDLPRPAPSTFTAASTCDGDGKCVDAERRPPASRTSAARTSARTPAPPTPTAPRPRSAANGSCGLKAPGQTCVTAAECASGFCSQSVCCATACTGACQSCALSDRARDLQQRPATGRADPQGTCHDQGNTSCGTDGFCDGNGACRQYAGGTSCAPPSCPSGELDADLGPHLRRQGHLPGGLDDQLRALRLQRQHGLQGGLLGRTPTACRPTSAIR